MATLRPPPCQPALDSTPAAEIGPSVIIKGQIIGRQHLVIDGEVEGAIEAQEHRVTIGPQGRISATVKAHEIVVHGAVRGDLHASGKVEICKTATVAGDVRTPHIVIEDGAYFKGSIDILRPPALERNAPSRSRAEARHLEDRYAELVEKKYVQGLSVSEETEMEELAVRLAEEDAVFYQPVLDRLRPAHNARPPESDLTTRGLRK